LLRLVVKACTLLSDRADVVTANSIAGMKSHLALGYRPRRSEIVANGIDVDEFKPNPSARAAVRRRLGVSENSIVVAHVARVDPMKDHETLFAAMAELPDLIALVIGAGTERLPDAPNVLRLGRRDDVATLLAAADVAASSSAFGEATIRLPPRYASLPTRRPQSVPLAALGRANRSRSTFRLKPPSRALPRFIRRCSRSIGATLDVLY
jgi:glycosyltransferase involved in cell wall biosynthesis